MKMVRSTSASMTHTVGILEAAGILHVHPKTVEELIRSGAIPAGKVGRAWVMMTRDVLAYAEKLIISQTAERLAAQRKITKAPPRGRTL
ncbi:helix-turn-helix domain-containing protein [Cupriavidus alkaliphilus]|uniref:helix-turn-helix domain-containing protein n=1 Tax=Cupriavidus alkaliphilus TaxID=942866 RepID=UPI00178E0C4B|nr:helix-turn-helix domain-containing protein [Cupriavidus alkaliphilus]MBB3014214.1 excisionase family DNA binding protein [Cupriavidus alkaliphilus]